MSIGDVSAGMEMPKYVEMPRYVSNKPVWAMEIEKIEVLNDGMRYRISFADKVSRSVPEKGYYPKVVNSESFARYSPSPGDFMVVCAGDTSFIPRNAFLEEYTRV